jgi:hypothetical protein
MSTAKKKRAPSKSPPLITELLRLTYNVLDALQTPFDWVFWLIDRPKTRIWRELKNEGGEQ